MKREGKIYTPEAIEKILPQKLKLFRKNQGLTTEQVGKLLNKTASAVTLWETGKSLPDVNTLIKRCEIYKVADLNDFLDQTAPLEAQCLASSEQELIRLWRKAPSSVKTAIKTILKQIGKD